MPAFFGLTCGAAACVKADEDRRAVEQADRVTVRGAAVDKADLERREREGTMVKRGFPLALVGHDVGEFEGHSLPDRPANVFMYGPNGTGKTALACALAKRWGQPAHFCSAYRILSRIKSTFRRTSSESEEDVLDELREWPVLVIDDLGAQHSTEFGLATLYEIVKERCENYRATVVTSNQTLTEIDKQEPRLASRLGAFRIIKLAGQDRRLGA